MVSSGKGRGTVQNNSSESNRRSQVGAQHQPVMQFAQTARRLRQRERRPDTAAGTGVGDYLFSRGLAASRAQAQ